MDEMATKMVDIANRIGQLETNIVTALQGRLQSRTCKPRPPSCRR